MKNRISPPPGPLSLWPVFFIFLAAHFVLTYAAPSILSKGLAFAFGVLLPFLWVLRRQPVVSGKTPAVYERELWRAPSPWVIFFFIFLFVFLRFYKLDSLFRWPNLDEGWNGILAVALSRQWHWRFFYTFGQAPPLPVWTAALLFKLGGSPFRCLWLPSAIVSVLTVFAGYFAAREFFSKSFSLLCGGLLAFSYWPLYLGRFCHQGIWLPLWVCSCLFLWGRFQNAGSGPFKKLWAAALGVGMGLGSFTFTPWIAVAACGGLTFLYGALSRPKKNRGFFFIFGFSFLAALLPFFCSLIQEGYGQHLLSVTAWSGWSSLKNQVWVVLGYLASLFGGPLQEGSAYTATGGGFLNPILSSFFFLGLLEALRFRRRPLVKWLFWAFPIFLLPGLLSMNVETFRIVQILPLLLLLTAWGLQSLLSFTPSGKRLPLLLLVFSLSLLLDGIRLVQPYADDSKPRFPEVWPIKSMESYRAYHLMWFMSHRNGPGLVFADFDPDSLNDPVLSVAAYPFNADGNPEIPVERAHWAALFVNTHYVPFLTRRFPKAKWYWVGQDQNSEDGGKALVIIPFTAQNQGTLCQWVGVHSIFRAADFVRFWQNQQDIPAILAILGKAYPLLKGDPFLESVYWEKTAAYEYENNENLDYDAHLHALRMAVQKGYPSAHLYFKLGLLLMAKNHFPEARQAFEKASHCAFNQTPSTQLLKMVNQMEKQHLSMETLYHLNR